FTLSPCHPVTVSSVAYGAQLLEFFIQGADELGPLPAPFYAAGQRVLQSTEVGFYRVVGQELGRGQRANGGAPVVERKPSVAEDATRLPRQEQQPLGLRHHDLVVARFSLQEPALLLARGA